MAAPGPFTFIRQIDPQALRKAPADTRVTQRLLDRSSGPGKCAVSYIRTPPGKGSPEGLHTHDFEQMFFLLEGSMRIEVDGEVFDVPAGSLIVFPEGVPHRNWNASNEPTIHLAINVPAPELGVPSARPVSQ